MILDENYVQTAENVIKKLVEDNKNNKNKNPLLTTSQIRKILAMAMDIYNQVLRNKSEELSQEIQDQIDYLRIRVVYECGRNNNTAVRNFVMESKLIDCLKEINGSKKNYIRFSHYLEALVAYRKFLARDKD